MARKVIVIGAGFSGLSAAAYLSRQGFDVEIVEKNTMAGGRARKLEADGFTFDMGPSAYWMPDIFDRFFAHFGTHFSNYYELVRLDPFLRIFSENQKVVDIPSTTEELIGLFESIEAGSGAKLNKLLQTAHKQYNLVMDKLIYKSGDSYWGYLNPKVMFGLLTSGFFKSYSAYVGRNFKDERLRRILDFPLLFLGSIPSKTPSVYNLINYANMEKGVWYPPGGIYKVVEAMEKVCYEFNVDITFNSNIDQFEILKGKVNGAHVGHRNFYGEFFVSSTDYYHADSQLLPSGGSNYGKKYWKKKILGPSALIFYIGISKRVPGLAHHNLFVEEDFNKQLDEIHKNPVWPENPTFFVSVPSKTDNTIAPEGCENMVVMAPVPPGLIDTGKIREHYFDILVKKIEKATNTKFRDNIVYHKSYAHTDFANDYNAYKGNAFGLANLYGQMGPSRPKIINRKLSNLFYTGHYTVPGPGVPTTIISGEIVAREIYRSSGGRKS